LASQINASNSGFGGIVSTGDSSGVLQLQAAGTTIATIASTGMTVGGRLNLPTWTTGTRPSSPATGTTGYNTTTGQIEAYGVIGWANAGTSGNSYTASYLIVAGGASGSGNQGGGAGGGGAGGLLTGTSALTSGTVYTITVGAGGAVSTNIFGNDGNNSTALGLTAIGGGGGATGNNNGRSGGSGGGSGEYSGNQGGAGTSGQGFAGGGTNFTGSSGGGGGAGAVGTAGNSGGNCNGGIGLTSSITGTSTYYAGGGGASTNNAPGGAGGLGGGGNGGAGSGGSGTVTSGTANTGGGGGGTYQSGAGTASGGSGVVILSVPTTNYSGTTTGSPTITTSGANTIIKFTASGSYTA